MILGILIGLNIFSIVIATRIQRDPSKAEDYEKFSALFDDLRTDNLFTMQFNSIFLLRRILIAFLLVILRDHALA